MSEHRRSIPFWLEYIRIAAFRALSEYLLKAVVRALISVPPVACGIRAAPPRHLHVPYTTMSEGGTKLKAAILIVSDTASKDASTDKCIPVLKDVFGTVGDDQWEVTETGIVPDDVLTIQKSIRKWTDGSEAVNLIVTSGGTGFATKDVTPEVCNSKLINVLRLTGQGGHSLTR
jgi:hypothetical protein